MKVSAPDGVKVSCSALNELRNILNISKCMTGQTLFTGLQCVKRAQSASLAIREEEALAEKGRGVQVCSCSSITTPAIPHAMHADGRASEACFFNNLLLMHTSCLQHVIMQSRACLFVPTSMLQCKYI